MKRPDLIKAFALSIKTSTLYLLSARISLESLIISSGGLDSFRDSSSSDCLWRLAIVFKSCKKMVMCEKYLFGFSVASSANNFLCHLEVAD